nr:hypothetical protein [Candidatus Sigynarchaeota archaeon]
MPALKGWEFLLGEACIATCLVFSVIYFNKARKTEENMKTLKQLNIGVGILMLFLFISRILDNPLAQMVDPLKTVELFGYPLQNAELYSYAIFFTSGTMIIGNVITMVYFVDMFFLTGLAIATFFMERAFIPKAHHIFFIFLISCAFVSFVIGPLTGQSIDIFALDFVFENVIETIFTIFGITSFAVIPVIYFILASKTTGDLRKNALFIAFGFICIIVDIHTVGHDGSGNWYRSVPCLLGFFLLWLGNKK